jgi:hypothetical protein
MKVKIVGRVAVTLMAMVPLGLMLGCAGMQDAPEHRKPGYAYYPKVLVDADRALDEARQQGKDKLCPKEYSETKARIDKAYEEYMMCITPASLPSVVCPPPTCELRTDKKKIEPGESVTLALTTWGYVTSAALDGTDVTTTGGTKKVTPTSTTTYTAKVSATGGSNTCDVTVQVIPPPPTCELRVNKGMIEPGESVTLALSTWGYVKSAVLDGTEVMTTGGIKKVTPTSTTTYTAKVSATGGSNTCDVTVQVIPPPPPMCELKVDKGKIDAGESVTLSLTTSGKVTSAVLDGTEVAQTGGTKKVEPASATIFTAKVAGPGGSNTCSVPVSLRLFLYVHFPFDRPRSGEDAKWFKNIDSINPEDAKDPANRGQSKATFLNTELKDNPAELKKAVDFVKKNANARITVTGHTDTKGTEEYNQSLSERRANAVKEYLIDQQAIDRKQITAKGLGEKNPIAKETTPDGKDNPAVRAKSRRVEITSEVISPR